MIAQVNIEGGHDASGEPGSSQRSICENWRPVQGGGLRRRWGCVESDISGSVALPTWDAPGGVSVAHFHASIAATAAAGLFVWRDYAVVSTTDGIIRAYPGSSFVPLTIATGVSLANPDTALASFAEDASDLFFCRSTQIYKWNATLPTATVIASSPISDVVLALGQRLISIKRDSQVWYYSALGDGGDSTWSALQAQAADELPDPLMGGIVCDGYLWIFGTRSFELFQPGVDAYVPYDKIRSAKFGLAATFGVTELDRVVYWIDDKRQIQAGSASGEVVAIDAQVRQEIVGLSRVDDCRAWTSSVDGKNRLIVFFFPSARRCYEYDVDAKQWTIRNSIFTGDASAGTHSIPMWEQRFEAATALTNKVVALAEAWPSNVISIPPTPPSSYYPDPAYRFVAIVPLGADSFDPHFSGPLGGRFEWVGDMDEKITPIIVSTFESRAQDFGVPTAKRGGALRVTIRRGNAAATSDDESIEVRCQDDGRQWTSWRRLPIGTAEQLFQVRTLWFGGIFYRRKYAFRFSGRTEVAIIKADQEFDAVTLEPRE